MTQGMLIAYVFAGGLGTWVFLKLVCDEIVVKNRVLRMRVDMAEEAAAKARIHEQDEPQVAAEMVEEEEVEAELADPVRRRHAGSR